MAENAELKAIIKAEVDQAINAFKKFDSQVKGTSKTINTGSAAATDFTRVIQDAPFGIIGVGNNIQQLATSFGSLVQAEKGVEGAFKALGSSLLGAGGIGFAISAITTAFTFAQVGLANWTRKTKEAKEKADEWAKAQHNSAVAIEKQRIETENLIKVARGDIGTKKEQTIALEKLNQLIPDNIGVLTEQNIKTAEGTRITTAYVQALSAQATAQLLIQKVAELNVANIEEENRLRKEITPLITAQQRQTRELAAAQKSGAIAQTGSMVAVSSGTDKAAESQSALNETTNKLNEAIAKSREVLHKNNLEIADYEKRIDSLLPKAVQLDEIVKKGTTKKEKKLPAPFNLDPATFKTQLIPLQQILNDFLKGGVTPGAKLGLQVITPENLQRAKEAQSLFREQQAQLTAISNLVGGELANAFNAVFDSAVKGEDLFKSLTQAVKQLVFNLIKAVAQALILEAIASAFGLKGGGTFLNGLLSGGTALQNGVSAGGIGGGPQLLAVGKISGQDILLSVQRTQRTNFING